MKNQGILDTLTKIQFHENILNLTNLKPLTNFKFSLQRIELDCECEPDLQLCNSVLIFKSMLTPVSLPDLDPILEPTMIAIPI